ncbi:MAG: Na/Pi cotransporter family protein [Ruminococcus sp.]|nr:Na/Pi cotransporter family protein [Ruminococcus sp.]
MDIFNVITLLGGLAFFLYGMTTMSNGLEKIAGGKLERALNKMTSNPFKGLVLGAGITIAIQSSSALTVMLVGLVNSGIMQLQQSVGVIMGSNIGTTLTAWILSLAGLEGDSVFIKLLKPTSFSPIVALIGILLIMAAKSTKKKDIGSILVGFAVLMYGMTLMGDAMKPLQGMPEFQRILTAFNNPILGVAVGAIFTGIIQSSAASVAILQSLASSGSVTFGMAIPIIMGQNIGTCVTSLISSIGVTKNAKRVAVVHISFNIIGTVVLLIAYYGSDAIFHYAFTDSSIDAFGIAVCHSIFNVTTTILLFPFNKLLVKLAEKIVPITEEKETYAFLDDRLLNTPAFAISECKNMTDKMAGIAHDAIANAITLDKLYDKDVCTYVITQEDELDHYEDKLGTFLVKISGNDLSDADSQKVSLLLHTIGDFERIGDHATNLVKVAEEMHSKKISFSPQAQAEIAVLTAALSEIVEMTTNAFCNDDLSLAAKVEPLEQVIDELIAEIKSRHIERLQKGNCTIELGFVLSDLINNYERVSDHCSNIAVALIEVAQKCFDTHEYLSALKQTGDEAYNKYFKAYQEQYSLALNT